MAIDRRTNDAVLHAIEREIAEHGAIGIQVAAYLRGELVVDAWGGVEGDHRHRDPHPGRARTARL
jgi:hypothetical protein